MEEPKKLQEEECLLYLQKAWPLYEILLASQKVRGLYLSLGKNIYSCENLSQQRRQPFILLLTGTSTDGGYPLLHMRIKDPSNIYADDLILISSIGEEYHKLASQILMFNIVGILSFGIIDYPPDLLNRYVNPFDPYILKERTTLYDL